MSEPAPYVKTGKTYRVAQMSVAPLLRLIFRVEVVGSDRIPRQGPVILAGTHRSNLDSVFLPLATRRQVNFMAKKEFFKHRLPALLFRHLGAFPVSRGEPDRQAMARALEVLECGAVLGIYPEGTRRSGETIKDLHRGASWLAGKSGAITIPVGIGGSERVQPKGAKYVKTVPVTLWCGPPVPAPESMGRPDLEHHTDRLRVALQEVFDLAGGPGPAWR